MELVSAPCIVYSGTACVPNEMTLKAPVPWLNREAASPIALPYSLQVLCASGHFTQASRFAGASGFGCCSKLMMSLRGLKRVSRLGLTVE